MSIKSIIMAGPTSQSREQVAFYCGENVAQKKNYYSLPGVVGNRNGEQNTSEKDGLGVKITLARRPKVETPPRRNGKKEQGEAKDLNYSSERTARWDCRIKSKILGKFQMSQDLDGHAKTKLRKQKKKKSRAPLLLSLHHETIALLKKQEGSAN